MTGGEVDELADILKIERLVNYYQLLADSFRWKEWSECFTEDAVYELPYLSEPLSGRDAIYENSQRKRDIVFSFTQHFIANHAITLKDTSHALAQSNVIFTGIPDPDIPDDYHQFGGRYIWAFRRDDGEDWLISGVRLQVLWRYRQSSGAHN